MTPPRAIILLDRFIDLMVLMERRCPGVVKKPGATTRRIPDAIVQALRALADEADDLLCALARESQRGEKHPR